MRSESSMIRSRGHCNTMGTASTMALMAEALGMTIPGLAGTPAADSRLLRGRPRGGHDWSSTWSREDRRPSGLLSRGSFQNAIVALAAVGGSTNAVSTCSPSPGGSGIELTLDDFDRVGSSRAAARRPAAGRSLPHGGLPSRRRPAGGAARGRGPARSRRADGHRQAAGRVPRRRADLGSRGHPDARRRRCSDEAGIAVLRGSLAPSGAVIKPAAASPELLRHRGPAVVFDSIEDFNARIDDPDLEVDADSVLVLRGCGPKGYPGMPEVANMPLPAKLLEQGVRDMVRICDGRMSGTAYGTVVLHVSPEAAAGRPAGAGPQRRPDRSSTSPARRLELDVPEAELAGRSPAPAATAASRSPVARLAEPVRRHGAAGRHRRRPRLPGRGQRRRGDP